MSSDLCTSLDGHEGLEGERCRYCGAWLPVSVEERVRITREQIESDIAKRVLPASVSSFSELHNYIDANSYGMTEHEYEDDILVESTEFNAMADAVDAWLKAGRPA